LSAPRRLDFRAGAATDDDLAPVVAHLEGGGLLAYPTETVYGFGCRVQAAPLARLRGLKGREADRPFLLLVPDVESVGRLAWTDDARELVRTFWPGALTLLLADPEADFPPGVRSPEGGVAVRRSSHPLARRLVELLGEPLTSTSANAPGSPPASSGEGAYAAARAAGAGEEMWVLDAGGLPESAPSTIVDFTGRTPRILRAGATPVGRLRCVLPRIDFQEPESHDPER
jgi:L-threonylcarbamoyladenylate synthase